MYNKEQKMQFINYSLKKSDGDIENLKKSWENFFNRIGKIEKDFDDDISNFSYETIMLALHLFLKGSVIYQETELSKLKLYIDWCIINGKTPNTENKIEYISLNDIDVSVAYKLSMVKDEEHLNNYLDEALREVELDTIDNLYRTYFLLLFNGIKSNDIFELKESDVNYENKMITFNDKSIQLYPEAFKNVSKLSSMDYYVGKIRGNKTCETERYRMGYLIENTTENRDLLKIYTRIKMSRMNVVLRKKLGKTISLNSNNIYISGIFYRIHQNELLTKTVDITEYVENYINPKASEASKNRYINAFKTQYEIWKKAFNLL
ncbi:phage lytic cycle repressor MrpR family protein [Anaerovorax sp. IOR16]|uniref:phage lytic cycle repressor MrpR family protein n=1 Tax=Anaerovorax sp. IOR16 TaxID=2773458 RepID=UPI0019D2B533|nr:hypothetical protein [Anaerovorax sp. IOR16]